MLSRDLRTMAAALAANIDPDSGAVVVPSRQLPLLMSAIADLAAQAEALEAVAVPTAARAVPEGVIDLAARRAARRAS
jgi:hypothetical protein